MNDQCIMMVVVVIMVAFFELFLQRGREEDVKCLCSFYIGISI